MTNRWAWRGAVFAIGMLPGALRAQEQPLSIRGTFSTGYYNTSTTGQAANQSLSFVPVGAMFDILGYYKSPDLVNFSLQPELNAGPQASDAGFQGGNGVRFSVTFLRKLIPLTFHYSNVQVEDVYFGSLTQLSGYSLKNRNKDLGVTLELKFKSSPQTTIDWGKDSVDSKSDTAGISDYLSHGNHLNVDSTYETKGWVMQGFYHRQQETSDLLAAANGGTQTGSLFQTVQESQGSVRRSFLKDSELYVDAGQQSTSTLLFTQPIGLGTHYVGANLRLRQRHRWKTSLRTTYSSNLASQFLEQAAGSLASGAGSVAPDGNVLVPFSHGISNLNATGLTSVTLPHGFGLTGSVEHNTLFSSGQGGSLNSKYFTGSAGVTYAKRLNWGSVSGEYTRQYGKGSITGQSGTIQGQDYRVGVQKGSASGVLMDASFHGDNQSVHNVQPLSSKSYTGEGTIGDRLFRDFTGRVGGGYQWSSIVNSANEFRTNGYTARAGIDHPRFQVNGTINNTLSNSLPFYSQLLEGVGVDSVLLPPMQKIPSDYRARSLSVHANLTRKIEVSAMWTRSRQHLDGVLNNDFELLDVHASYRFRRLQLEAGYIRSQQVYASYPNVQRDRIYIRVSRSVRIL